MPVPRSGAGCARGMRRHRALIPLSHDHHETLVAARRLRRGADGPELTAAATAFLAFFAASAVPHCRQQEELLFPGVADAVEAHELVLQALLEDRRLHAGAAELREFVVQGSAEPAVAECMRELAHSSKTTCGSRKDGCSR
jgi:hypothetical protein